MGLGNLGNTCFMNAGLQCLSHLEPVCSYFLTGRYLCEINDSNPLSTGGALARAFARLQERLWQGAARIHNPKQMHSMLSRFAPHLFQGAAQQDVQEFLAYVVDGLHEDLNMMGIGKKTDSKGKSESKVEDKGKTEGGKSEEKGEESAANHAWTAHLAQHRSFLVDLFQGQLRSRVTCLVCRTQSVTFDPYLYISVPVRNDTSSLEDALRLFLSEERLVGSEKWWCPRCKDRVSAKKKIDIFRIPPLLVVHLKRFEFDAKTRRFRKIKVDVRSPLAVDLSFLSKGTLMYNIVCIANHTGAYGTGHYTAICRHPVDGKFYHFDDEFVDEVQDTSNVLTHEAYVLFLEHDAEASEKLRRQKAKAHAQNSEKPSRSEAPTPSSGHGGPLQQQECAHSAASSSVKTATTPATGSTSKATPAATTSLSTKASATTPTANSSLKATKDPVAGSSPKAAKDPPASSLLKAAKDPTMSPLLKPAATACAGANGVSEQPCEGAVAHPVRLHGAAQAEAIDHAAPPRQELHPPTPTSTSTASSIISPPRGSSSSRGPGRGSGGRGQSRGLGARATRTGGTAGHANATRRGTGQSQNTSEVEQAMGGPCSHQTADTVVAEKPSGTCGVIKQL